MFRALPHPSSGVYNCTSSLWFYRWSVAIAALLFVVWKSTTNKAQHDCRHDTKVKPEAATAVIELLMMGGKTLETC
jgi:hypothetical protein